MGPYCDFCDHRCFVERFVPGSHVTILATCGKGMAHDRERTGYDHTTAVNPNDPAVMAYAEAIRLRAAKVTARSIVGVVGAALVGQPDAARTVADALTRAGHDTWNRGETPDA